MNVAVLGAGPSGMMAAWSAFEMGHRVTIYDRDPVAARNAAINGSVSAGVFLLHKHCGLTPLIGTERRVFYDVMGKGWVKSHILAQQYVDKVYGSATQVERDAIKPSFLQYRGAPAEWDGRFALKLLWDILGNFVVGMEGDGIPRRPDGAESFRVMVGADKVISTIPLPHYFPDIARESWEEYSAKVLVYNGTAPDEESYVWYAPFQSVPWYRTAGAFGVFTQEWAAASVDGLTLTGNLAAAKEVLKPIQPPSEVDSVIRSLGNGVLFTGRFGAWRKGVEQDTVYDDVKEWLTDARDSELRSN